MRALPKLVAAALAAAVPAAAAAHGINGHVWATDQAVQFVDDCAVAAFLAEPEVRAVLQIAPAFPDSGYAIEHDYGEAAHWPPFVQSGLTYLAATYDGTFATLEERQYLAFLMGAAAHGIEDEIFDSLFVHRSVEADGADQDLLDTFTDFSLVGWDVARLQPDVWLPPHGLPQVFADPRVGVDVRQQDFEYGMFVVREVVIGLADIPAPVADGFDSLIPWAAAHVLDPDVPGSIGFEPHVVGPYLRAIWQRAHGRFDPQDIVIGSFPAAGRRQRALDPASVDSWLTVVFGAGVRNAGLTEASVRLRAADGATVPATVVRSRWTDDSDNDWSRLVTVRPAVALEPDAAYTVEIDAGLELIDGSRTSAPLDVAFRSACASGAACADLAAPAPAAAGCVPPTATTAPGAPGGGCRAGHGDAALQPLLLLPLLWIWRRLRAMV